MAKQELDNLVRIQKLKAESASRKEFVGMLESAGKHLTDAQNESIDPEASSIWPMAPRTGSRSLHYATKDTAPKIGLPFSRRSLTPWVRTHPTDKSS